MKIIYKKGNALSGPEPMFVHGCNAQGVMGSGIARQVKDTWPEAFYAYKVSARKLGSITVAYPGEKVIINAITQEFYGNDGRKYVDYDAIAKAMRQISNLFGDTNNPVHLAMPKIGAGLGGGQWSTIEKIIEQSLVGIQAVVYEY